MYPEIRQTGAGLEGRSFGYHLDMASAMIETHEQTDWGLSVIICNLPVGKMHMTNDLKREASQEWLSRHDDGALPFNKGWAQEAHLKAHSLLDIPVAL